MSAPETELARVWADAVPLYEFVSERAEREPRKPTLPPAVDEPASKDATVQALRSMSAAFEHARVNNAAFDKAKKATLNDLIAGRIVCIGREEERYQFERLEPLLWIGAEVNWYLNRLTRDGRNVIEIRVATVPLNPPQARLGPGRPSKMDAIRSAIAKYAEQDPHLGRPPHER